MTPEEVAAKNEETLRAYAVCFSSPSGQIVLADLSAFCRAAETCIVPGDPQMTAVNEGRREAWLRIQKFARLSEDEILQLRLGRIRPRSVE